MCVSESLTNILCGRNLLQNLIQDLNLSQLSTAYHLPSATLTPLNRFIFVLE